MKIINIGKENATFQEIVALKDNRTKRCQKKMFFVEGVQNIKEAIANDWKIFAFIYEQDKKLSDWAKGYLNYADFNYVLTKDLMKKLSDKEDTSELLAIIEMKEHFLEMTTKVPLIVLLDRPAKKGNFGSIIRSCDALFVDKIYFIGHGVDIYDHEVITASMGSFFKVPFYFLSTNYELENLINKCKEKYKDFQVVGTSLQTENRLQDCDFTKPTMLLVGNETWGLSQFLCDKADNLVKITMREGIDSLNVASATTTCLYEISRQRLN